MLRVRADDELPGAVAIVADVGIPGDRERLIAELASDAGSYITGQSLLVDGGFTAR